MSKRVQSNVKLTATLVLLACASCSAAPPLKTARITARPANPTGACTPGVRPLGLASGRDGQFFVPKSAASAKRLRLVVFLHGATQGSWLGMEVLQDVAEKEGFLLLVPESRAVTWDAIRGYFGPDIVFLNRALEQVFRQCSVDPGKVTLAGFSDGATYALSLGIANGDLFSRIMAFSPGFLIPAGASGKPLIFISHGTRDQILPIDQTSRRIVEELQGKGYNVVFREFDGKHQVPPDIVEQAVQWAR